ncbi:hypothetical protein [Chitinophaga nivalis]|uniref:Cell wall anchor protein n=1 Tax=Chitinophaga nivalis TaxID=2991709 RepID=A0ABT3IM08_9BACT|nr:hypothetical protein [Chitinophaga nivalis]MCW3465312.1 hypothetical protein [Chitinophaga nivalis]MCW3484996.1 hypothetical protein [Chitinophaga nivalis]
MKYSFLTALLLTSGTAVFAQNATTISVNDTRSIQEIPDSFRRQARFDMKFRNVVGVPGTGHYSAMLTMAPWNDSTGGKVHQLNFNAGGIFYRQGLQKQGWENWTKLITDSGAQTINGAFTFTGTDRMQEFNSPRTGAYQYTSYTDPGGRRAWVGIDPQNNYTIAREKGGHILLLGANVGIGTSDPAYKLAVNGTIGAQRVKVTSTGWPDFVFREDYALPALKEVAAFIAAHRHLPDIPAAGEIEQEGHDLGEMNKKLLQKIEELTLYMIQQDKKLEAVRKELQQLKAARQK